MDVINSRLRGIKPLLGGLVDVVRWALIFVIHADTADEGALAVGVAEGCEGVGCWDMNGCKVRGARCAVGESASDDLIVDA